MQARAAKAALDDARIPMRDVDGLLVAGLWGVPGPGQLASVTLGEYLGIIPRFADTTNIGGSAFEAHVAHAAMAIEKGYCDVALIVYGSTQKSERSRTLGGRPSVLTMQFENVWGIPQPVGGYAMAAKRHMHEHGTTEEQLAEIAVATRAWAHLNPAATMRDLITIDDVMNSTRDLRSAEAARLLPRDRRRRRHRHDHGRQRQGARLARRSHIRGYGEAHTHWSIGAMPDLARLTAAEMSSKAAFDMAGISRDAIDLVECYDSFTITVLLTLEALGFCKRGEGGQFVMNQRTAPGGSFPLNTNGGGLSYCHPGMYGIFLLVEAVRQLRGEAGDRQVKGVETGARSRHRRHAVVGRHRHSREQLRRSPMSEPLAYEKPQPVIDPGTEAVLGCRARASPVDPALPRLRQASLLPARTLPALPFGRHRVDGCQRQGRDLFLHDRPQAGRPGLRRRRALRHRDDRAGRRSAHADQHHHEGCRAGRDRRPRDREVRRRDAGAHPAEVHARQGLR